MRKPFFKVQAIIVPVRYLDFDSSTNKNEGRGDGIVEKYIVPFIGNGTNQADMIITMSQSKLGYYNIDRFATIIRRGADDNLNYKRKKGSPSVWLKSQEWKKWHWIETTLPEAMVMDGGASQSPNTWNHFVVYAQYYRVKKRKSDISEFPDYGKQWSNSIDNYTRSNPGAIFTKQKKNAPSLYANQTKTKLKITEGTGGSYLSNEVFYRVALARERWKASTGLDYPTGHFHIAKIQSYTTQNPGGTQLKNNYLLSTTRTGFDELTKLINTVKKSITDGINQMGTLFTSV